MGRAVLVVGPVKPSAYQKPSGSVVFGGYDYDCSKASVMRRGPTLKVWRRPANCTVAITSDKLCP
ncbi:uncharacterized protein SETTUDRAFT_165840 [Exserohilum turcica Et28A]|uniref:Uncharacterized protein n=1 Tax=Exserohilum turcicum (strain 28A) TaxID=671987 RepID=R0I7A8_EXST2|nr:uncharacterized protein SETTUDRAFT_165840 [Exserohilum turcica Et28A]EOA81356.1 hypothetical protein SETTUDRAFT_165840 [Exserohilum turcica Et28A]